MYPQTRTRAFYHASFENCIVNSNHQSWEGAVGKTPVINVKSAGRLHSRLMIIQTLELMSWRRGNELYKILLHSPVTCVLINYIYTLNVSRQEANFVVYDHFARALTSKLRYFQQNIGQLRFDRSNNINTEISFMLHSAFYVWAHDLLSTDMS